jgi:hypothetical protein
MLPVSGPKPKAPGGLFKLKVSQGKSRHLKVSQGKKFSGMA